MTFTLHPLTASLDDDPDYALVSHLELAEDQGLILGNLEQVKQVRTLLDPLITAGEHDGEIDHLDPLFDDRWLTVDEAVEYARKLDFETPPNFNRTIRYAAAHGFIPRARKIGRDWTFHTMRFLGWLNNRPKPGRKERP